MRVLVIAPHNDDETLGVGGAMAMYARKGHEVYVCEATSGPDQGMADKIKAEALKAHAILGVKETIFLDLPVVALGDMAAAELNEADTDGAVSHSDELEARDRISKVMRIIETLPSNQRLVITMHDIEGRTKEEIEHATELSADNVRQLLSRARRFIRDCFAKE